MTTRYEEYLKQRNNMQHPAKFCLCWMQQRPRVWLREQDTVSVGDDLHVAVPGLGTLRFEMRWDEDHDSWDTDHVEKEWRDWNDTSQHIRTGRRLGDGWYAIAHWDRGYKFLAVKFSGGGDYESRREYYSAQGMSRGEADVHARQAIQAECRYWHKIAEGEISWVGWIVTLFDEDETCLADDSCWGYEASDDYIHECMDDAARSLVLAQYELKHKLTGIDNVHIAEAKLAWDTAMVTSDYDRDLADPLFISIVREKVCQKSLCL